MNDTLTTIGRYGLVPIIKIDRPQDAIPLGKALLEAGLPCAEITFRTAAAAEAIRTMASAYPELLLGAGTVMTIEQAEQAMAAGARFLVAPGFDPELVDWAVAHDIDILPGIATATDVTMAVKRGLKVLKVFPVEAMGGVALLKALSGPFGGIKYVPTGGVSAKNLADYLALSSVHAAGGSWMVENKLIAGGRFDEITRLTAEACAIVRQVRGS